MAYNELIKNFEKIRAYCGSSMSTASRAARNMMPKIGKQYRDPCERYAKISA